MNTLHIVMGAPAAGKTTYAKRLAKEKKASLIDIDSATERVVQAGLDLATKNPDDRDSPFFKDSFRAPIYETLFAIAKDNLCHNSVILVGPFTLEARDANWLENLKLRSLIANFSVQRNRKNQPKNLSCSARRVTG